MKICIVTTIFPPDVGGPATYVYELAKRLSKNNEVHIMTYGKNKARLDNVFVHSCNVVKMPKFLSLFYRIICLSFLLFKIIKKYKIDVVYAFNIDLAGVPAFIASKVYRKKLVLRTGGDYVWEVMYKLNYTNKSLLDFYKYEKGFLFSLLKNFQKFMLKRFDRIIINSNFYKNLLIEYFDIKEEKIEVIRNPINVESKIIKRKHKTFDLIVASRLLKLKGIDYTLKAMSILVKKYKNIRFLIIGEGPYKDELIKLVKDLGINNNVDFLGYLDHEKTLELIKDSDAYVMSSVSEVSPNCIIEAMSLKTAVISTIEGGTKELVNSNVGLIIPKENVDEIVKAVEKLMKDSKLRNRIRNNAYKYVKESFKWEDITTQTLKILK